jgi:hypothetical protein
VFILGFHATDKGKVDEACWCCKNEHEKKKSEGMENEKVIAGKSGFVIGKS